MPSDEEKELLSFAARSKDVMLRENSTLKMSWYSHVLTTLEKLDNHVDSLTGELYKQKDEFRKDLYELREKMRLETADIKSLGALEKHLDGVIEKIEVELAKYKVECKNEITIGDKTLKAEFIKLMEPFNKQMLKIEVKVAVWGALAGVAGSGSVAFILYLLKDKLFGG